MEKGKAIGNIDDGTGVGKGKGKAKIIVDERIPYTITKCKGPPDCDCCCHTDLAHQCTDPVSPDGSPPTAEQLSLHRNANGEPDLSGILVICGSCDTLSRRSLRIAQKSARPLWASGRPFIEQPPPELPTTPLQTHEEIVARCALAALDNYNEREGTDFELLEAVMMHIGAGPPNRLHTNFTAKPKIPDCTDPSPKLFFAELTSDFQFSHSFAVTKCCIVDPCDSATTTKHCRVCRWYEGDICHPVGGSNREHFSG